MIISLGRLTGGGIKLMWGGELTEKIRNHKIDERLWNTGYSPKKNFSSLVDLKKKHYVGETMIFDYERKKQQVHWHEYFNRTWNVFREKTGLIASTVRLKS